MKIITISTIDVDSNAEGICLVQIIVDEDKGSRVVFNGVDVQNAIALMEQIGNAGASMVRNDN